MNLLSGWAKFVDEYRVFLPWLLGLMLGSGFGLAQAIGGLWGLALFLVLLAYLVTTPVYIHRLLSNAEARASKMASKMAPKRKR